MLISTSSAFLLLLVYYLRCSTSQQVGANISPRMYTTPSGTVQCQSSIHYTGTLVNHTDGPVVSAAVSPARCLVGRGNPGDDHGAKVIVTLRTVMQPWQDSWTDSAVTNQVTFVLPAVRLRAVYVCFALSILEGQDDSN